MKGFVIFNLEKQAVSYRNNTFDAYLGYYFPEDEQEKPLDLRYNYWGRDWYIEDLIGFENKYDYSTKWGDHMKILFEPYYDKNGTLTDTDTLPNGWEAYYGLNIYENDSDIDSDNDGLTNYQEWEQGGNYTQGGFDPSDPDMDDDLGADRLRHPGI